MPATANGSENQVRQLQRALYQAAKRSPNRRFHSLYDKICSESVLRRAWEQVKANRGQGGIDGQNIREIEEGIGVTVFLKQIQKELQEGGYHPQPVRRVEIPKASGGVRPLGIPTLKDRTVQAACRVAVEPIFEADFLDCSYGFRPKRSARQAHEVIRKTVNSGYQWVVDGDIEKYFDSIPHEKLMKLVEMRISDRKVLRLIRGWLKAGTWKDGVRTETVLGTPQGGVISPLLSNIYLHYFDRLWHKHYGKLGKLVRYADDFVILCPREQEADQSLKAVASLLQRFDLRLHPEKTRKVKMVNGEEGFDFLGFHFHKVESYRYPGKLYCLSWPSKTAMKKVFGRIKDLTSNPCLFRLPLDEIVAPLNPVIRGWVNYFKVGNSSRKFTALDSYVRRRLHLVFRRKFVKITWLQSAMKLKGLNLFKADGKVGWASSYATGV